MQMMRCACLRGLAAAAVLGRARQRHACGGAAWAHASPDLSAVRRPLDSALTMTALALT